MARSVAHRDEHPMSARYRRGVSEPIALGVLGPVAAWDAAGAPIALRGPRHRAVLARLVVAQGRVVPVDRLVDDLWIDPPPGAVSAVRTFVAALRVALEPDRPPRAPARLLVTDGPGYALRVPLEAVDAWRFAQAVPDAAARPAGEALPRLEAALALWRGPAYADLPDEHWAQAERSRLTELRLHAVERRAEAQLALGQAAAAVPDLDAHVAQHPWREDGWRLLALALYRTGRQADALAVLRRARTLLVEQLGVEPGPALRDLETDILHHADRLVAPAGTGAGVDQVWAQAAAAYERTVAPGSRARLEASVGLLRDLAVTGAGGLQESRRHRLAAITAAQELGDPLLTARVIGAYDVPAVWTRSDDPAQAARIVAAAERTLTLLPPGPHDAARARLLATIAVESRGTSPRRGPQAAAEAERLARRLDDPALLAFALNGTFMQAFERAGLAPRRAAIGDELVDLSRRHGLASFAVLGHLVALQARSAMADFARADVDAAAVDELARRHERPLVGVFTQWYRALALAAQGDAPLAEVDAAYRAAGRRLEGSGMPGLQDGLLALARLAVHLERGAAPPADLVAAPAAAYGPYEPWVRPVLLLAQDRPDAAAAALGRTPPPPPDLLLEALWCLTAIAAVALGDVPAMERARAALAPAQAELAGAGSGLLSLGPVARRLARLDEALSAARA
jgi:DNA-binding SARP family transcriptional activator